MGDANNDDAANGICLPYDVLLEVLRRIPGRPLAKFRLVCRAWRGIVDAHSLRLPHVFPREFPGVFTTYYGYWAEYDFFAPPGWRTQPPHDAGEPTFVCPPFTYEAYIQQHCNGLLLLRDKYVFESAHYTYVCNPATRREDRLPLPPTPWRCDVEGMFLAFDPAVSRHHEVFLFPKERTPPRSWDILEPMETWWVDDEHLCLHRLFGQDQQEMHSLRVLRLIVFSSRTGQWERREFLPGHCSSGRLYDLVKEPRNVAKRTWWSAEYWHGSLYIHCHSGVLMILRCSERTYDTVELPSCPDTDDDEEEEEQEELRNTWTLPKRSILASYEIGVHYVVLNKLRVHVWMLTESIGDELGWIMTHKADLRPHDNVLDFVTVQPRMRWEVVGCSKRDLYGIIMNREIRKNNQACLSKYNSHERSNNVEEEDNYDKAEELNRREGCGHSWNTEEHSDVSMDENVAAAIGLEGDSDDDETTRDDSEYSWNSNKHNFIDIGEGIAASLMLEEDGEEDDGDDDEAEEDPGTYGSQHTDDIGWGCRIVGFHPHKNVLLLYLSHVGVAYHLDTSRMQYLGYMFPKRAKKQTRGIHGAFPYRPCFIDALPV